MLRGRDGGHRPQPLRLHGPSEEADRQLQERSDVLSPVDAGIAACASQTVVQVRIVTMIRDKTLDSLNIGSASRLTRSKSIFNAKNVPELEAYK